MKAVLFYTIIGYRYPKIMAVTTEKRRQYYGRWVEDDSSTHVPLYKAKGRFDNLTKAESTVEAMRQTWMVLDLARSPLEAQIMKLERDADEQIKRIIAMAGGDQLEDPPEPGSVKLWQ